MLLVEWEYIRLYINSLALQAVAERESTQTMGIDNQSIRISEEDAIYIDHVVDASKSILNYMIYEFAPRGYLRLSPVKVFLRVISAAVFLVKVCISSTTLIDRLLLLVEDKQILIRLSLYWIQQSEFFAQRQLMISISLIVFLCY
jgi:hypothetical protein